MFDIFAWKYVWNDQLLKQLADWLIVAALDATHHQETMMFWVKVFLLFHCKK